MGASEPAVVHDCTCYHCEPHDDLCRVVLEWGAVVNPPSPLYVALMPPVLTRIGR